MLIWEANERDPPNPLKKKEKKETREIFSQLFSDCIYIYIYEERERERERICTSDLCANYTTAFLGYFNRF